MNWAFLVVLMHGKFLRIMFILIIQNTNTFSISVIKNHLSIFAQLQLLIDKIDKFLFSNKDGATMTKSTMQTRKKIR